MKNNTTREIRIEREFNAPRESVWKAWADPDKFKKWWGPKDFTCPVAHITFREGGMYHVAMHGPKGSEFDKDLWSTGVYKKIVPMEKITVTDSFSDDKGNVVSPTEYGMPETFPRESTINIKLDKLDGKTKMTVRYPDAKGIEGRMRDEMIKGWQESFDKLAKTVE